LRSDDVREKEISPKLIIFSVLFAGPAVNNCRAVSINYPCLLSCAISFGKSRGIGIDTFQA
jgi:hypothetical protein